MKAIVQPSRFEVTAMIDQDQILNLLKNKTFIKTSDISRNLGISISTTLRHLNKLETMGLLKRVHGGVIPTSNPSAELPISLRTQEHALEKELIGRVAASLIQPRETVFLGSGSTTLNVARNLLGRKNISVITNSLAILKTLEYEKGIELICLGGIFRHSEESFIGYLAESALQSLRPAKVIIGISAISIKEGLTNEYLPEISTDKVIIQSASEVILVADHSKFGKIATTVVAPITAVNKVITDSGIDPHLVNELTKRGLEITIAK